jgi:hypothetical protein
MIGAQFDIAHRALRRRLPFGPFLIEFARGTGLYATAPTDQEAALESRPVQNADLHSVCPLAFSSS